MPRLKSLVGPTPLWTFGDVEAASIRRPQLCGMLTSPPSHRRDRNLCISEFALSTLSHHSTHAKPPRRFEPHNRHLLAHSRGRSLGQHSDSVRLFNHKWPGWLRKRQHLQTDVFGYPSGNSNCKRSAGERPQYVAYSNQTNRTRDMERTGRRRRVCIYPWGCRHRSAGQQNRANSWRSVRALCRDQSKLDRRIYLGSNSSTRSE